MTRRKSITAVASLVAALLVVSGIGAWALTGAMTGSPAPSQGAKAGSKDTKTTSKAKPAAKQKPMAAPTQTPAQAPASQAARPSAMGRTTLLLLVRGTLSALQQANETGNYSVLHDMAAPGFQSMNDTRKLASIFAGLRSSGLDLSGVVVVDLAIAMPAMIDGQGRLHVSGAFPSQPRDVTFDLVYEPVAGRWRPFGISVGTRAPSAQVALPPSAPAPSPAPRKAEAARPASEDPLDRFMAPADAGRR